MPSKKQKKRSRATVALREAPPVPVLGHAEILAALQTAFPSGVFLLARLHDPTLRLSDRTPHVFIPDTHIVPLREIKNWPGRVLPPSRTDRLKALLGALDRLRKEDPSITVWHLGDLFDLWRTGPVAGLGTSDRLERLNRDWSDLMDRFDPSHPLPIQRIYGNHDEGLGSNPRILARQLVPEDPGNTAGSDMLVTHGHQFDPLEITWPASIKETLMRGFTEVITPYARDFMSACNPHWLPPKDTTYIPPATPKAAERAEFVCPDLTAADLVPLATDSWNVEEIKLVVRPDVNPLNLGTGPSVVQDERNPSLWSLGKIVAREAGAAGYSVALTVVGHTHNPRIIRGQQLDGSPFVLMDCGGWIGPRFLSPGLNQIIHNCTIGVRVGSDMRIYQLSADAYDWRREIDSI